MTIYERSDRHKQRLVPPIFLVFHACSLSLVIVWVMNMKPQFVDHIRCCVCASDCFFFLFISLWISNETLSFVRLRVVSQSRRFVFTYMLASSSFVGLVHCYRWVLFCLCSNNKYSLVCVFFLSFVRSVFMTTMKRKACLFHIFFLLCCSHSST